MWFEDYQWHYDYVRLAWDTGFSFEKCKSPNLDKNKICVVDVDRIVKERDVASVDRYISTVVQYILDDEQAKVLDTNFVKIFRISQLAVEYLLFCKKYLDNTVTLLKKELTTNREENKELKIYIEDLQGHIETLTKQQAFASFKCTLCSKAFASEDYLNAHIKRRHNKQSLDNSNLETDRLNMEIKELKERLNNTEKLLKEKDEQSTEKNNNIDESSKVVQLLQKFDNLKNEIDNELKELKLQKTFYEENYGKLFNLVVNKENIEPKTLKIETTTQTDKVLQVENVQNKNVVEVQEINFNSDDIVDTQVKEKDIIETKISATLAGIEGQIQAFWTKLNEIENKSNLPANDIIAIKEVKPKAKPRSKLTQPNQNTVQDLENKEKLKNAIEELEDVKIVKENEVKEASKTLKRPQLIVQDIVSEDSESEDEEEESQSESEFSKSESEEEFPERKHEDVVSDSKLKSAKLANIRTPEHTPSPAKPKEKPLVTNLKKQDHLSVKKSSSSKTLIDINKEVDEMVHRRLQELGISENWNKLPQKSFDRALEIINHQATLTKKTYSNFNSVKKRIINFVEKQSSKNINSKTQLEIRTPRAKSNTEKVQNIVKIAYRPKNNKKLRNSSNPKSPKRDIIEIKNRALYETDTESEKNYKQTTKNLSNSHQWYSNVVEELKSLPKKNSTDEESLEEAKKGVLKSFPSVGSLSKKKVLFDLESEPSNIIEELQLPVANQKTGGSTTSIASSILGEKVDDTTQDKGKINSKNIEKDLEYISDFDFSDL